MNSFTHSYIHKSDSQLVTESLSEKVTYRDATHLKLKHIWCSYLKPPPRRTCNARMDLSFSTILSRKQKAIISETFKHRVASADYFVPQSGCMYVSIIPGKKSASWQLVAVFMGLNTMQSEKNDGKLRKSTQNQRKYSSNRQGIFFAGVFGFFSRYGIYLCIYMTHVY